MSAASLKIGLAGFGTVGSGVYNTLKRNHDLIQRRTGGRFALEITKIAVRDMKKKRDADAPTELFTGDWREVVNSPDVDIVVELIGGTTDAYDLVEAALKNGKPVVTGNKALLAELGPELFALSSKYKVPIHFEAAVAGGIPIIRTIQDSFVGNQIERFTGIINGTSNYMLERMTKGGLSYEAALAEAQDKGYAEADPALDVNGWDAAHKAILLASLAYGFPIDPTDVYVRGIQKVRPIDVSFAEKLGYVIKLLSIVRHHDDGRIELRTQPCFLPTEHILASVNGVFNAVALHGDAVGESMFYGEGAGQDPTASSVMADIVEAARAIESGAHHRGYLPYSETGEVVPIDETIGSFYVRFDVTDRPGVIAEIAKVIADAGLGISGTSSPVNSKDPDAEFRDMVFLIHSCAFGLLKKTLKKIEKLDCVNSRPVVFRIETTGC